jgi:hypothetical protein
MREDRKRVKSAVKSILRRTFLWVIAHRLEEKNLVLEGRKCMRTIMHK